MTKLEMSVRKSLNCYRNSLKAGRYWTHGMSGLQPDDFIGYISAAVADVEDGLCTDITLYVVGDAMEQRHYYMEDGTVNILEPTCDYIESSERSRYDNLVYEICELIKASAITAAEQDPEYTGEFITLSDYAERHGRTPDAARHRAQRGGFKTAKKIGRDWIIREDEPYGDNRLASERIKNE